MERKLGEIFACNGKLYQVVKGFSCNGCAFIKNGDCYLADKLLGPCAYKEIAEKLNKDICFFIAKGKIQSYSQYASYDNPDVANSYRQIEKILAINQLMNIAKYYNGDWKPNWSNSKENKFCIKFDYHKDRLYVDYNNSIGAGDVFFKNSEDARTVINNPNFRNILNTIYKD